MARGALIRGGIGAIALCAVAISAGGCSDERTLSAEEFVRLVGEQGVEVELGEQLSTGGEAKEVHAIELVPLPGAPHPDAGEGGHAHTGGSVYVYDSAGAAEDGIDACRTAADLLCYQAANVVVILEGGGLEAQRLGVAIKKLGEE
jgi:hypothetical protein